jgi:hypothetical protein
LLSDGALLLYGEFTVTADGGVMLDCSKTTHLVDYLRWADKLGAPA